jgi:DNA-binding beta-propeller fold protein YncE
LPEGKTPNIKSTRIMKTKSSVVSRLSSGTFWALLMMSPGAFAQNLFVSENIGSGVVYEYTPGGSRSTFASTGLDYPYGLAFDAAGNLYVANNINDAGSGGYVTEITRGGVSSTIPSGPDPRTRFQLFRRLV